MVKRNFGPPADARGNVGCGGLVRHGRGDVPEARLEGARVREAAASSLLADLGGVACAGSP
eukprot:687444-Rhodomonas_salina.1